MFARPDPEFSGHGLSFTLRGMLADSSKTSSQTIWIGKLRPIAFALSIPGSQERPSHRYRPFRSSPWNRPSRSRPFQSGSRQSHDCDIRTVAAFIECLELLNDFIDRHFHGLAVMRLFCESCRSSIARWLLSLRPEISNLHRNVVLFPSPGKSG